MKRKIIIIGVILLMFGIIGLLKGKNMKPKEPIPQEVIEFAQLQEGGELYYLGEWQEKKVYEIVYPEPGGIIWSLPNVILFDGKKCEHVDTDYAFDIFEQLDNP